MYEVPGYLTDDDALREWVGVVRKLAAEPRPIDGTRMNDPQAREAFERLLLAHTQQGSDAILPPDIFRIAGATLRTHTLSDDETRLYCRDMGTSWTTRWVTEAISARRKMSRRTMIYLFRLLGGGPPVIVRHEWTAAFILNELQTGGFTWGVSGHPADSGAEGVIFRGRKVWFIGRDIYCQICAWAKVAAAPVVTKGAHCSSILRREALARRARREGAEAAATKTYVRVKPTHSGWADCVLSRLALRLTNKWTGRVPTLYAPAPKEFVLALVEGGFGWNPKRKVARFNGRRVRGGGYLTYVAICAWAGLPCAPAGDDGRTPS